MREVTQGTWTEIKPGDRFILADFSHDGIRYYKIVVTNVEERGRSHSWGDEPCYQFSYQPYGNDKERHSWYGWGVMHAPCRNIFRMGGAEQLVCRADERIVR